MAYFFIKVCLKGLTLDSVCKINSSFFFANELFAFCREARMTQ